MKILTNQKSKQIINKTEKWRFTTFDGGVQNINMGGCRDIDSIGVRAIFG